MTQMTPGSMQVQHWSLTQFTPASMEIAEERNFENAIVTGRKETAKKVTWEKCRERVPMSNDIREINAVIRNGNGDNK